MYINLYMKIAFVDLGTENNIGTSSRNTFEIFSGRRMT